MNVSDELIGAASVVVLSVTVAGISALDVSEAELVLSSSRLRWADLRDIEISSRLKADRTEMLLNMRS
jgi:hypothetical protein